MSYYFNTTIKNRSFDEVIETVKSELAKEGFGVPAEVDVQGTFKMKLGIDFRKYRILCACNPVYAKQAMWKLRQSIRRLQCLPLKIRWFRRWLLRLPAVLNGWFSNWAETKTDKKRKAAQKPHGFVERPNLLI